MIVVVCAFLQARNLFWFVVINFHRSVSFSVVCRVPGLPKQLLFKFIALYQRGFCV